jgi:peptidoglycan/LPS O-acetylase OafA/YrhL
VRFLLALVVTVTHFQQFTSPPVWGHHPIHEAWIRFGATGAVFGFFLISGFSVAASYERDEQQFYFRRALRIMPLYVPIMVFAAMLPGFFGDFLVFPQGIYFMPSYQEVVLNLCMTQGYVSRTLPNNLPAWSLAIEVGLYALTPWFARFSNAGLKRLIYASAGAYILSAYLAPGDWLPLGGIKLVVLAWLYLLGVLIYRDRGNFTFGLVLGVVVAPLNLPLFQGQWFPALWVLCIASVCYGSRLQIPRVMARCLSVLGDASYPLYLVHMPFFALLAGLGFKPETWTIVAAACCAMALDWCYDRPVKRLILTMTSRSPKKATPVPAAGVLQETNVAVS